MWNKLKNALLGPFVWHYVDSGLMQYGQTELGHYYAIEHGAIVFGRQRLVPFLKWFKRNQVPGWRVTTPHSKLGREFSFNIYRHHGLQAVHDRVDHCHL